MELEVLADKEAVARRAAEILAGADGHVALSGGSTPRRAYALAAGCRSDWRGVTLWLGDERHVPFADPESNAGMVREELLTRVPSQTLPAFEPVDTSYDLEGAADDYDARLRAAMGDGGRLQLALMGLGPDSHTASLFPGKAAMHVRDRLAVAVPDAGMEPYVPRITLTVPAFNAAEEVVFLVAGADKAEAVARAFGSTPDLSSPSSHVRPGSGVLRVLADQDAAARLG